MDNYYWETEKFYVFKKKGLVLGLKSIRYKIMIWTGLCLVVMSIVIISYAAYSTYKTSIQRAKERVQNSAIAISEHINSKFEKIEADLLSISTILTQTQEPLETLYLERDHIDTILISILKHNPEYSGVYTCWLPNAYDNRDWFYQNEPGYDSTGRFSHYWYRNIYGIIEVAPLEHNEKDMFPVNHHEISNKLLTTPYNKEIAGNSVSVISLMVPINIKDKYYGLVGIDYNVEFLYPLITDKSIIIRNGGIFLISDNNVLICSTDDSNQENDCNCKIDYSKYFEDNNGLNSEKPFSVTTQEETQFIVPIDIPGSKPWAIVVSLPKYNISTKAVSMTQSLIIIGIIFIVLSLFIIWLLAGYISTPLILLVNEINKIGRGSYKHSITIHNTRDEIGVLSRAFNDMRLNIIERENDLNKSLLEKETLIRELYHRTKNNMQVISSMLSLKAMYINDEKLSKVCKDVEYKIQTMALVHQKLYKSQDLSKIHLDEYLKDLITLSINNYNLDYSKITIEMNLDPIIVMIDTAMPFGLIVSELISNSLKHAFPTKKNNKMKIQLTIDENENIELKIADNGIGFPVDFNFRATKTLGITTVIGLVENQMNGKIKLKQTEWIIQFEDNLYKDRIKNEK